MNIFRKLACLVLLAVPVLQGCNSFGVRGTALRQPTGHVSEVVVDISQAGALMGPFWSSSLAPAITAHTPAAFATYNIRAVTYTLMNEEATKPPSMLKHAYVVHVTAKDRWSGSSGTVYGLNVSFLSPQGEQLWAGTAGFAWNPMRDYDKSAQEFVENIARQLSDAGMFNGDLNKIGTAHQSARGLSAGAQAALATYKDTPNPKAFVVDDGGRWISVSGQSSSAEPSPSERALKTCVQSGFNGCRVLAINDTVFN